MDIVTRCVAGGSALAILSLLVGAALILTNVSFAVGMVFLAVPVAVFAVAALVTLGGIAFGKIPV